MKARNGMAVALLVIGLSQMMGYLSGIRAMRGIGLASGVAPFPKVFCAADGYEAFAAKFFVEGTFPNGEVWSREVDPQWYASMHGPYNRRNVYGAALAFAPRLPVELRDAVLEEALKPGSALRRELQVPGDLKEVRVRIVPREGEVDGPWIFPPS
ncbi:hypothetical protein ACFQY0_18945 [Haloferula chungangensis]|uniref:Uncharacterized protein n=1 Tax=Haloferula chungangensis TaxID=1048331 RepID=A0ABW2LC75_9BACT